MKLRFTIPVVALLAGTALAAATYVASSAFLSAPAGTPIHFQWVALPDVAVLPDARPPHGGPAKDSPFNPTLDELVNGNTVITSEKQFKYVWATLFSGTFDPTLVDFNKEFVVLMGGGAMSMGSFGIGSVERVDAQYPAFGFGFPGSGNDTDPFISVTSTTFFPGIMPQDPPPPHYFISAVKISKEFFDDVVFHRSYVYGV